MACSSVAMNFKSPKKRAILTTNQPIPPNSAGKKLKLENTVISRHVSETTNLEDLCPDTLEVIAKNLDTQTCLNLMRTCKLIHRNLSRSPGFWKHLCHNENFHEYTALKNDEEAEEIPKRTSWSLEVFHDVNVDSDAPKWRRIFQRGIGMRRNICHGKFELWRLFLTDGDSLPVKKMTKDTSFRELRTYHRHSPRAKDPRRRVRIRRYWNEDFLVAVQFSKRQFNDLYVWRWKECQQPEFMYNYDLYNEYPQGLFPTAFFLWKHYLVLMPDTGYFRDEMILTSMIRVHDLKDNMKLVGRYDFPQEGQKRRHLRSENGGFSNETAHLHKLGDKAVGFCRTPKLSLFVFKLPDGQLLREVTLFNHLPNPLEDFDLDQRFLMKDNTMIFMFHDPEFFSDLFHNGTNGIIHQDNDDANRNKRYGKLLYVDFDAFVRNIDSEIELKVDETFDCNDDYIEKISVMSSDRMAVAFASGKIIIREVKAISSNTCTSIDKLIIPCPENLREELDADLEEMDTDGPSLCSSRNGEVILVMRHFESGRRIHAYDISRKGRVLYTINLDESSLKLTKIPGYISIDIDGNFLCAADQDKIVIWNARNGKYIRTIDIPPHYDHREDKNEAQDKYCWKGHTDFAFAEDGIIIIHSQRNFPIAADVMLFW